MDPFEEQLKALSLRKPSNEFGKRETLTDVLQSADSTVTLVARMKAMTWKSRIASAASLAAAAILCYVVVAAFTEGTVAFAEVAEKLRRATTLSYKSVVQDPNTGELKMEARHYFMVPGQLRTESSDENGETGYSVFNIPAKKLLLVDLRGKVARVSSIEGASERDMAAETIEHVRNLSDNPTRTLGKQIIDGVTTQGYEIEAERQTTKVWVDAENGDPLRIEIWSPNVIDGPLTVVWTEIKLNEALDPELFSVAVPAGFEEKPFMKVDLSASPANYVAEFLRIYAKRMEGAYPERLQDGLKEITDKIGPPAPGESLEDEIMKLSFHGAAVVAVTRASRQGDRWDYYSDVPPGSTDEIVFWLRGRQGDIHAVFGDLRVEVITEEQLPKSTVEE